MIYHVLSQIIIPLFLGLLILLNRSRLARSVYKYDITFGRYTNTDSGQGKIGLDYAKAICLLIALAMILSGLFNLVEFWFFDVGRGI